MDFLAISNVILIPFKLKKNLKGKKLKRNSFNQLFVCKSKYNFFQNYKTVFKTIITFHIQAIILLINNKNANSLSKNMALDLQGDSLR